MIVKEKCLRIIKTKGLNQWTIRVYYFVIVTFTYSNLEIQNGQKKKNAKRVKGIINL